VFWIVDNGSSHRGQRAADRLYGQWPSLVLVHTLVHASWVNQIEIYFSIVLQRKLLTPSDFEDLDQVKSGSKTSSGSATTSPEPFARNFHPRKDAPMAGPPHPPDHARTRRMTATDPSDDHHLEVLQGIHYHWGASAEEV
jgi:hypothetical protein